MKKGLLLFIFLLCLQIASIAQVFNPWGPPPNQRDIKPNLVRFLLSHVSGEVSFGYGNTRYFQNLDNQVLYSGNGQLYLATLDSAGNQYNLIGNWLNKPILSDSINVNSPAQYEPNNSELDPNSPYLIDTLQRRLRGGGNALPISIKGFITYDRFRVGGGATFEFNGKSTMSLKGFPDYISNYNSDYKSFVTQKYYFMAGIRYYDFWDFSYYVDIEYGKFNYTKSVFPRSNVSYSKYWNLSFPIEKNLSEYFHLVIRPSIDFKSVETNVFQTEAIQTKMWNVQLQAGVRLSFPLYPKCPISNCEVQKEHIHINKKFRGQPLHKKQNPKVGENYPYLSTQKRSFFGIFKRK